jgi:saccharopine dehydrogenase-like NADP-dependent oxidoreductase
VDNEHTMREYGSQAVVWQTAINPVVALELLNAQAWSGAGVLGPEAFPPKPYLERLRELGYPHASVERAP